MAGIHDLPPVRPFRTGAVEISISTEALLDEALDGANCAESMPNGRRWSRIVGEADGPRTSRSDNRRFVEAVLWIVGRGALGVIFRRPSATGTLFSSVTATGLKRTSSRGCSRSARMRQTWNPPWSTLPSSRSIAMDRAQRGSQSQAIGRSEGGVTTETGADGGAGQCSVRLLPGHPFDTRAWLRHRRSHL